jgi:demethylmenaquinone methyltransferase / 2-methoxy-6-polyprenyl-1,4-benzoquinol methylase
MPDRSIESNSEPSANPARTEPSRRQVYKMFDRIAGRYDLLNRLLSSGIDHRWRARMAGMLQERDNLEVLDLASGTADQLIALHATGRVARGVGLDLAEQMLAIGHDKIRRLGLDQKLTLAIGDAENLPFQSGSFDAVTISFGIRNMTDPARTLAEMHRVLKSGGRALILEFSLPSNRVVRRVYLVYLRHILPRLGALISGDSSAYRYLNETIETFPYGDAFCQLMSNAGFTNVVCTPLTLGIASIYVGEKR